MDYVVTVFPLLYFHVAVCLRRIIILCSFIDRHTYLPGFISTETVSSIGCAMGLRPWSVVVILLHLIIIIT